MSEQIDILGKVVRRLEGAGFAYMLSGSMALSLYAAPRMTRDMDIVIELESTETDRFVKLFLADFYIDDEAVASAVSSSRMFNIIHNASVTKLDFIVRKDTPYRREEFANRQRMDLGSLELGVADALASCRS